MTRIEALSAVSLAVADMRRSVSFYRQLGFELAHGGESATFTTFRAGDGFLNLERSEGGGGGWGRVIFHVADVDAVHARALRLGLSPEFPPRDARWGERYFHLRDPDGHEISFARRLD